MSDTRRSNEKLSARVSRTPRRSQNVETETSKSQPEIKGQSVGVNESEGYTDQREIANESQITVRCYSGSSHRSSPATEAAAVRLGRCKWFNVAKGWGFITPHDGGQDVFVHQSVIQMRGFRSLAEQEEVEFECKVTERGLEATRVCAHGGSDCRGSSLRPRTNKRIRRMRCYNCGKFANHIASQCNRGPQPKRCHLCKSLDHLFAECPRRKVDQKI